MAKKFEELECWQLGLKLDTDIFELIENSNIKRYFSLKDQMLGSSRSIADNIGEGFERGGNKEFIQFLFIAKGSCGELRTQIHRCKGRKLIDEATFTTFHNNCTTVSVKISNLITYLKNSDLKGNKYKIETNK